MTHAPTRSRRPAAVRALALCACVALPLAAAADDKSGERAARRAQLQMQNLQQQLQSAQAAQAQADAGKAEADRKIATQEKDLAQAHAGARRAADALKVAEAERAQLRARVDELEKRAAEDKRASDAALARKTAEFDALVRTRDAQQAQLQGRFDNETVQLALCSAKNERLVKLGGELIDRYRDKGFAQVLRQREQVVGIGDVQMFNYVQDTRDRLDAERLPPPAAGQKP